MGIVIQFPEHRGTGVLHFDGKHPFGEITSLTL
jgi:hypothetical protein